jgi:ATP-dependent phosphofructokinase / diphosphate-dependent phosphofructokinase
MTTKNGKKKLAILASGGPAPGINSVINAATIEAINLGWEVYGVRDGFRGLVIDDMRPLTLDDVSFIHFEGGCILGMSRTNPRKDGNMAPIIETIKRHEIDYLLTIGGDDTAFGAREVAAELRGSLRTVHVPKTIDNDLPLPEGVPTFGFTTARQVGTDLVKNLMKDARTCSRWYVVISMGRQAGHLALGMAKSAGANLSIIPEEFANRKVTLNEIASIVEGAVIKGLVRNRPWGVAVLAEGLIESLDTADLENFPDTPRDAFGHVQLADVRLGEWLCKELDSRMSSRKLKTRFNEVKLGYELRCADPVPFDIEYTRDLGFAAVRLLVEGGTEAMVMIVNGKRQSVSFDALRDETTGRTRVRNVDVNAESYLVARRFMQRLTRKDFDDMQDVERLADAANCTPEEFRAHFEHIVAHEPASFSWEDSVRDAIEF